jgi:hypothetical protein
MTPKKQTLRALAWSRGFTEVWVGEAAHMTNYTKAEATAYDSCAIPPGSVVWCGARSRRAAEAGLRAALEALPKVRAK